MGLSLVVTINQIWIPQTMDSGNQISTDDCWGIIAKPASPYLAPAAAFFFPGFKKNLRDQQMDRSTDTDMHNLKTKNPYSRKCQGSLEFANLEMAHVPEQCFIAT